MIDAGTLAFEPQAGQETVLLAPTSFDILITLYSKNIDLRTERTEH